MIALNRKCLKSLIQGVFALVCDVMTGWPPLQPGISRTRRYPTQFAPLTTVGLLLKSTQFAFNAKLLVLLAANSKRECVT